MHPFTLTYIAMAKAAREIQATRSLGLESGDYANCDLLGVFIWPLPADAEESDRHDSDTWLPRLDQLLAMLNTSKDDPIPVFWWHLGQWGYLEYLGENEDREAYWCELKKDVHALVLAVVMRERYGKIWDGKGWAKA